jgi:hypothetical protein
MRVVSGRQAAMPDPRVVWERLSDADRATVRALCRPHIQLGEPPGAREPASRGQILEELKQTNRPLGIEGLKSRLGRIFSKFGLEGPEHGKAKELAQLVYDHGLIDGWGSRQPLAASTPPMTEGASSEPQVEAATSLMRPRYRRRFAAIAAAVLVLVLAIVGISSLGGEGARPPARLLVIIDVTGTMRHSLDPDDPNSISRIEAARLFAAGRIDQLDKNDRIGVWLLTNSRIKLRNCDWVPPTHCVIQPLTDATAHVKTNLEQLLRSLRANDGGTPLYEAMALGVKALRHDRASSGGPAGAISSLVVVTDGVEHAPGANGKAALAAVADETNSVQILITAAKKHLCDTKLKVAVRELFASKCIDASHIRKAKAAQSAIVRAIRMRLPAPKPST